MSLWATGSHEGFGHESAPGRQWSGSPAGSAAHNPWGPSLPSHCPGPITQQPSLLLVLVGLPWPGCKGPAPVFMCRGRDCGPKRISEGHILRFPVSGPGPSSCVLAWPQVLHPWGLSSLRRNAVPGQGNRQGQGRRETVQTHPYPHHVGNWVSDCCKTMGINALTVLTPKDLDTLGHSCHCDWRAAEDWSGDPHFLPCRVGVLRIWGLQKGTDRASLVAQWLRILLARQATLVRSLVWNDPTCLRAAKPVTHD